jgi:hypothetical protein
MANQRLNSSTRASIDKSKIFAQGTFKIVWRGVYTQGSRAGQACVAKEFKTGSGYEAYNFREELAIVASAQAIIDKWTEARVVNRRIMLNTPEIWADLGSGGKRALIEPFIENFEKFNSNTGWADVTGGSWSEAMQALSHFSYYSSRGRLLLCDIQGGAYRDG